MTLEHFQTSLSRSDPPTGISPFLLALWFDAKGNWEKAHHLIQDLPDDTASWIHAYLHRKEGDTGNAGYWYAKAGKPVSRLPLEKEWQEIAGGLCALSGE